MPGTPGTTIGPYVIDREIGRGGMGVVYLGRDTRLDRPVAVKALPEHLASDPLRLERFEREARAMAALNHPHVAGIYGVEKQDGSTYLVLEYVEGETLAERLDRGPLPVHEAIEIAMQIAGAMEAAHDADVIHRDLKPGNIKITPDVKVKVLDFGLAKTDTAGRASSVTAAESPTLTAAAPHSPTVPGVILGTAPYMSPEQARGRRIDRRSDIWSFAVVLYECLTGTCPFGGETVTDSIGAILHRDVDFDLLPPGTPPRIRRVLRRCLQRDAGRRYHHMADVRLDLEDGDLEDVDRKDVDRDAAGPTERASASRAWTWVALVMMFAAAVSAWGWYRAVFHAPDGPVVRTSIVAPKGSGYSQPRISPDGRQILVNGYPRRVGLPGEVPVDSLYVRQVDQPAAVKVARSDGVENAAFSPDGRVLAFTAVGTEFGSIAHLYRCPSDLSAPPVEILRVPSSFRSGSASGYGFSWTSDGRITFIDRENRSLVIYDPGTGREDARLAIVSDEERPDLGSLCWPFGDHHVAVHLNRYAAEGFREDAAIIDIRTGKLTVIVEDANFPMLLPDARLLFSRSDTLYVTAFDTAQLRPVGDFRPVESGLATHQTWNHGMYGISATGTLVYTPGGVQGDARSIVRTDLDGTEHTWSVEARPFEQALGISPDGSRMAVIVVSPSGVYEIWVSEVAQPRLRRLLAAPGTDFYDPCFTRDGEHLIVPRWDPGAEEPGMLLKVRFDGTSPPQRVFGGWLRPDWVTAVSTTANDTRALLRWTDPDGAGLHMIDLTGGGEPTLLFRAPSVYAPCLAPIEQPILAYITDETGRPEAYVRALTDDGPGPAIPVSSRGSWKVFWSQGEDDELRLHNVDLERREWIIPVTPGERIHVGAPRATGRALDERVIKATMAGDGQLFTMNRGENEHWPTQVEIVTNWLTSLERR